MTSRMQAPIRRARLLHMLQRRPQPLALERLSREVVLIDRHQIHPLQSAS